MRTKSMSRMGGLTAAVVVASTLVRFAEAAPILCKDTAKNHMSMDDSQVSACLDAGTGNINGNPGNDPFLTGGGSAAGYTLASKDDATNPFNIQTSQTGSSGKWSINASFWASNTVGAIGFKFGTGNQADEWFVYQLVQNVSSGTWDFINKFGKGGGLSHTNLYSTNQPPPPVVVTEPAALSLLLLGIAGLVVGATTRRRR